MEEMIIFVYNGLEFHALERKETIHASFTFELKDYWSNPCDYWSNEIGILKYLENERIKRKLDSE